MPKTPYLSIFDLDHTLINANCSFRFGVFLYQRKHISFFAMLHHGFCYAMHKLGLLSLEHTHKKIFNKLFLGLEASHISKLAESFVSESFAEMINLPAVECLKLSQTAGHYTMILSSSPDFLVSQFAKKFDVSAWAATAYEVSNKKFSGIGSLMLSQEKVAFAQSFMRQVQISQDQSTAYSDSILDLPLLNMAGKAVGVNPDRALRRQCKKLQWQIL